MDPFHVNHSIFITWVEIAENSWNAINNSLKECIFSENGNFFYGISLYFLLKYGKVRYIISLSWKMYILQWYLSNSSIAQNVIIQYSQINWILWQ